MRMMRLIDQRTRRPFFVALEGSTWRRLTGDVGKQPRPAGKISSRFMRVLPVCGPSKIVLVGLNYADHAQELGYDIPGTPVIFLKPPSSVIGNKDAIVYPDGVDRIDHEAELAIVMKKEAHKVLPKDVHKYILGYTCLNDVTARNLQKQDGQWTRSKSFDTFCPIGPWIETGLTPEAAEDLNISCRVNGQTRQSSSTKHFIFGIREMVSFISHCMTLHPFDIISTGTPPGVGPLHVGDVVEVEIEKVGTLVNKVSK